MSSPHHTRSERGERRRRNEPQIGEVDFGYGAVCGRDVEARDDAVGAVGAILAVVVERRDQVFGSLRARGLGGHAGDERLLFAVLVEHDAHALLVELHRLHAARQLRQAHVLAEAVRRTQLDQLDVNAARTLHIAHLHLHRGHRLERAHVLVVHVQGALHVLVGRLQVALVHALLGALEQLLDAHLGRLLARGALLLAVICFNFVNQQPF